MFIKDLSIKEKEMVLEYFIDQLHNNHNNKTIYQKILNRIKIMKFNIRDNG